MSCTAYLRHFLFSHGRLIGEENSDRPSGVPLYAYRCTEQSYQELLTLISTNLPLALRGKMPLSFEACFCLYAAETFRREHSGGAWAWRTVFQPLGAEVPTNTVVTGWIEKGLRYWGRDVFVGESGKRMFLVTIACEGGLPLRLLQNEGAKLQVFFRKILERYHEYRGGSPEIAHLARQQLNYLPKSLRNEEVAQLASNLIARTVKLQEIVGDATDPITLLDTKEPRWRSTLPLRMDDDIAVSLFKNLVEESRALAKSMAERPAWNGELFRINSGCYQVRKALVFPEKLPHADLNHWLDGQAPLSPRVRLMLVHNEKSEPVANLTLFTRSQDNAYYRREWLRRNGVILSGMSLLEPHAIGLNDGEATHNLTLKNDEYWGESPWVFVPSKDEHSWSWLAEGSSRTHCEKAMVVLSPSHTPVTDDEGTCEKVGAIPELERNVYQVTGTVKFETCEGDVYQVDCGSASETRAALGLSGKELSFHTNRNPVYLGFPKFTETTAEGLKIKPEGIVQWRPIADGESWKPVSDNCLGRMWMRLVDPETNVERVRRKAEVLPSELKIDRHIGTNNQGGAYSISGSSHASVSILTPPSARIINGISLDSLEIECSPLVGRDIEQISVKFVWPGRQPVTLELPYPQQGAIFQLDGRTLGLDELVALNRLYGLRLTLQSPATGTRFFLDAELVASNTKNGHASKLGFISQLPPLKNGSVELNMYSWVDQIKSLLAARDDPEAWVRLSVQSRTGEILSRLHVARYDMEIKPRMGTDTVYLPEEQCEKLGDKIHEKISLEMFPLWDPCMENRKLTPVAGVPGSWQVPWDLDPGPWWIIGHDDGLSRFRPLLWTVRSVNEQSEPNAEQSSVVDAVREENFIQRAEFIDTALVEIGKYPDYSDWGLIFAYIERSVEIPPTSIDVLRHLTRHPHTLIMALLKADDVNFGRLWSFTDEMPFSWDLLPVADWRHSAVKYYAGLRESLSEIEGGEEILWEKFQKLRLDTTALQCGFSSLFDWMQEALFPDKALSKSLLSIARCRQMEFILAQVLGEENDLLSRHDAEEQWPLAGDVLDQADSGLLSDDFLYKNSPQHQRPVRCAPFVAAAIAMDARVPSEDLVYQLRKIRNFDTSWFDQAYMYGLAIALACDNWEGVL